MRLATFNIRHGQPSGSDETDTPRMVRSVAALGAHVVALQEVDVGLVRSGLVNQAEAAGVGAGMSWHFGPVVSRHPGAEYGNALLHHGVAESVDRVLLPSEGSEQRGAIVAELVVDGTRLTIAVTHLAHKRPGVTHRAEEQLDHLLALMADTEGPCVVMGDLNLEADVVVPRLTAAGFSVGEGAATFPATNPRRTIDWIALRGMAATAVVVPDIRASDHRPLVVECHALDDAEEEGT